MNRMIAYFLVLVIGFVVALSYQTVFNPFTSKLDYVNNMTDLSGTNVAKIGNCTAGQVVQNITISGPLCVAMASFVPASAWVNDSVFVNTSLYVNMSANYAGASAWVQRNLTLNSGIIFNANSSSQILANATGCTIIKGFTSTIYVC